MSLKNVMRFGLACMVACIGAILWATYLSYLDGKRLEVTCNRLCLPHTYVSKLSTGTQCVCDTRFQIKDVP